MKKDQVLLDIMVRVGLVPVLFYKRAADIKMNNAGFANLDGPG